MKLLIRHDPDNDSDIDEHSFRRQAKYEVELVDHIRGSRYEW